MQDAVLRLFNGVQVKNKKSHAHSDRVLKRTVKNGYVLEDYIKPDKNLLDQIESIVGISGEKANAAFHKSWAVVKDTPVETLVLQQILHYFTTYGFESLGIYDSQLVYIPHEQLELPEVRSDIPLVVIKALTQDEILGKIIELASGIALSQQVLNDIMTIVQSNGYDVSFVEKIKNRELKGLLCDYYEIVPTEPVEFLRYVVSKLTDESLVIKNDYLIEKIKTSNGKFLDHLLKNAPDNLASIFFRFKPLFLAMKTISKNKTFFNQLRKKANKLHKPLPMDYLNNVTAMVKRYDPELSKLEKKLTGISIWRKIRLAYALNYRLNDPDSIVYRVRNGKGWATDFGWPRDLGHTELDVVLKSIAKNLKHLKGNIIYIPNTINYTLPATEKKFTGHFPTGTSVMVPQDMIVGIHWTNTDKRIDLDLSLVDENSKIGWDASYRTDSRSIMFSGDVTDAPKPNGASELFYIQSGVDSKIMLVNFYNFTQGDEVTAKVLVAHEKPDNFDKNYMVDVNNIIASANIKLNRRQNVLGLIAGNRFYFGNIYIGNSITSRANEHSEYARRYLVNNFVNSIDLGSILRKSGCVVVNEKPEEEHIDLSPIAIDKNTIINLLQTN